METGHEEREKGGFLKVGKEESTILLVIWADQTTKNVYSIHNS